MNKIDPRSDDLKKLEIIGDAVRIMGEIIKDVKKSKEKIMVSLDEKNTECSIALSQID